MLKIELMWRWSHINCYKIDIICIKCTKFALGVADVLGVVTHTCSAPVTNSPVPMACRPASRPVNHPDWLETNADESDIQTWNDNCIPRQICLIKNQFLFYLCKLSNFTACFGNSYVKGEFYKKLISSSMLLYNNSFRIYWTICAWHVLLATCLLYLMSYLVKA